MRKFMHERNCIDAIFSRLSSSCCHSHTTTTTRRISAVHVEANKKWALHNFQIASCTFRAIKTVLFSFDSNKLGRRDLLAISRHFGRTTEMQRKSPTTNGSMPGKRERKLWVLWTFNRWEKQRIEIWTFVFDSMLDSKLCLWMEFFSVDYVTDLRFIISSLGEDMKAPITFPAHCDWSTNVNQIQHSISSKEFTTRFKLDENESTNFSTKKHFPLDFSLFISLHSWS